MRVLKCLCRVTVNLEFMCLITVLNAGKKLQYFKDNLLDEIKPMRFQKANYSDFSIEGN